MHQFMSSECIPSSHVVLTREHGVEHIGLILRKIGPPKLRTTLLRTQMINAGRHRDA